MKIADKITCFFYIFIVIFSSCEAGNDRKTTSDSSSVHPKNDSTSLSTKEAVKTDENKIAEATALIIRNALVNDIFKKELTKMDSADRKFSFQQADLNNDGKSEIFVGFRGSYFCGNAGCTLLLLDSSGNKIASFTIVQLPVIALAHTTNGYKDLLITSKGVPYLVQWKNGRYPSNPSMQTRFTGHKSGKDKLILDENEKQIYWYNF